MLLTFVRTTIYYDSNSSSSSWRRSKYNNDIQWNIENPQKLIPDNGQVNSYCRQTTCKYKLTVGSTTVLPSNIWCYIILYQSSIFINDTTINYANYTN